MRVRVCGARCHNAKRGTCRCWCGGVFHGAAGTTAREAFRRELRVTVVPTTERAFLEATGQSDLFAAVEPGDRWRRAIAAAVEARAGGLTGTSLARALELERAVAATEV